MKNTLFHINWGDGDNSFVIAPNKKVAIEKMPDGKDMVNRVVRLDALYQMIFKAGIEEGTKQILQLAIHNQNVYDEYWGYLCIEPDELQAKLKEWGITDDPQS